MKPASIFKYCLPLFLLIIAQNLYAQNPVNWTPQQLIEPAALAEKIQSGKASPVVYSVGPGAIIPNSIDIGMVKDSAALQAFKNKLATLPKATNIVVYCGCCPFEHCPNVRPAIEVLKAMKFTNYQLLDLPHNIKTDWLDKGYPSTKLK